MRIAATRSVASARVRSLHDSHRINGWCSAPEQPLAMPRCNLPTHETSMTSRNFLISLATVALALPMSRPCHGHELMEAHWCSAPQQQIQIIQTFQFKGRSMMELLREEQTHGVVDRYSGVSLALTSYCQKQADLLGSGYESRAIITGPQSYVSPAHHQTYDIFDGVEGGCAICVQSANPRAPRPSLDADPSVSP
jgi:hypothetical protein